jgi:tRNA threonylcarbamoyladenosine biosynthesis protein TsaB
MKVLLINTCGDVGVVAMGDETGVVAEDRLPGRGTSEALMPAVRGVFAAAGWTPRELEAVGVVNGPGSFTGVRVGLSAAKGLCEGLGVGMVAMSRLKLVAGSGRHRVAVLDAGRGEFFVGEYDGGRMVREELTSEEQVRGMMAAGLMAVTCESRVAERLGVELAGEPDAEAMLAEVSRRVGVGEWSEVAEVDANYLRRTDAELLQAKKHSK